MSRVAPAYLWRFWNAFETEARPGASPKRQSPTMETKYSRTVTYSG